MSASDDLTLAVDGLSRQTELLHSSADALAQDVSLLQPAVYQRGVDADRLGALYKQARDKLKTALEPYRDFEVAISLDYVQRRLKDLLQSSSHTSDLPIENLVPGHNSHCDAVDSDLIEFSADVKLDANGTSLPIHFAVSMNFGGDKVKVILSHEAHICGLASSSDALMNTVNDRLRTAVAALSWPTDQPTNLAGVTRWNGGYVRLLYLNIDPSKTHISVAGRFPYYVSDVVQIERDDPTSNVGYQTPALMDEIKHGYDFGIRVSSGFLSRIVTDIAERTTGVYPRTEPARNVVTDPFDPSHNVISFGITLHNFYTVCDQPRMVLWPPWNMHIECDHWKSEDFRLQAWFIARFKKVPNGTSTGLKLQIFNMKTNAQLAEKDVPLGPGITDVDSEVSRDFTTFYIKY
jgi:hypothetical protein